MLINQSKLTPSYEMPAITLDQIKRLWTRNVTDSQLVKLCQAACDGDAAARAQLTRVWHTAWRAEELDELSRTKIVINDVDGDAVQTVDSGLAAHVRQRFSATHPVQALINEAIMHGSAQATYQIDGEEYTTQVVAE